MVRVPNTQSLSVLLGNPIDLHDPVPLFDHLSAEDIDRLIVRCDKALRAHRRDSLSRDVETAELALGAIESIQQMLINLREEVPVEKRTTLDAALRR